MTGARAGRAIIVGGSMSGLLSGLLLRRAGWAVDIYERVDSELSGRGAGIVAQYELIERLRGLGLATDELGVHVTTRKILDAQGRLTHEIECPQVLTAWERVYRLLRDGFPPEHYHRGHGLTKFTQGQDSVLAHFSNGEIIETDLLVGADGIRSTVRQQCLAEVTPRYAGYCAWRALVAERVFPPEVHRELFEYMTFGLPPKTYSQNPIRNWVKPNVARNQMMSGWFTSCFTSIRSTPNASKNITPMVRISARKAATFSCEIPQRTRIS